MSIAEVMVSLAISTMLLVGAATAYNASANAVDSNDRFFRATQAGRVTMTQILAEIRRADSVRTAPTKDSIIIDRSPEARINSEERSREFFYDAVRKQITLKIYYQRPDGSTYQSPLYTMARNVEEAVFGPPDTSAGVEVRVPVTITVKMGPNSIRLAGTSGIRRAL